MSNTEWAHAKVRKMLATLMSVCAAELQVAGLASLAAAQQCRRWR